MMQDGDNLYEPFFLEQAIPNVVAERLRTHVAQAETGDRRPMRIICDPVERGLNCVETTLGLVRNMLIVVRLNVSEIPLGVREEPNCIAHAVRRSRRRAFHSPRVM